MMTNSIEADLVKGDSPILLVDLPEESFIPRRRGRKLHKSIPFRWRAQGLECLRSPSGFFTTRSAVLRFFTQLESKNHPQAPRDSTDKRMRQVQAAEMRLAASGI